MPFVLARFNTELREAEWDLIQNMLFSHTQTETQTKTCGHSVRRAVQLNRLNDPLLHYNTFLSFIFSDGCEV